MIELQEQIAKMKEEFEKETAQLKKNLSEQTQLRSESEENNLESEFCRLWGSCVSVFWVLEGLPNQFWLL